MRMIRQQEGLSLLQLAIQTGIDPSALSRYERSTRRIPLEHAFTLATFFDCSVEYLMGRDEPNGDNGDNGEQADVA